MFGFYNILFRLLFPLLFPIYFFRILWQGNGMVGFGERFGRYSIDLMQSITNREMLWLHVGGGTDLNLCRELVQAVRERLPNAKIVLSTRSTTAMAELRRRFPFEVAKVYYPIDARKFVARALGKLHPSAVILVGTEIWPNFVWRAHALDIPLFLVNASISGRAYGGYRRLSSLFRPLFRSLAAVGAQSEAQAARLTGVGCRPEAVQVVGDLAAEAAKAVPTANGQATAKSGASDSQFAGPIARTVDMLVPYFAERGLYVAS